LLRTADALHRNVTGQMTGGNLTPVDELPAVTKLYSPAGYVPVAVCGAHLAGQPLNHQLTSAGAFLIEKCCTAPEYKLYALRGTAPPKPGLVRSPRSGRGIEVEVWAVPEDKFGGFVAGVPPPLGIGSCTLENGRVVKSFICESSALTDAEDITSFGGWRVFLAARGAGINA
jgi:allophanate hydrolase